jgi:RNA polymerase sigma-70 factor (ECF subfamily)
LEFLLGLCILKLDLQYRFISSGMARRLQKERGMSEQINFSKDEWQLAYRVALRVLKTPDQAEDAAQDAMLSAFRGRDRFAGRAKPESWLYRIAHNTALSYLRKPFARRYAAVDVSKVIDSRGVRDELPADESPVDAVAARELAEDLGQCLDEMPEKDRLAFTERFLLGTSERELGEILGVSTNAAKQRAFRARRAVKLHFAASNGLA